MRKKRELTREMLEGFGIDDVSRDGNHIFRYGEEVKQGVISCKHKYSEKKDYRIVCIYDTEGPKKSVKRRYTRKDGTVKEYYSYETLTQVFLVHNIVYAWYKGVSPSDKDVDHINGDSLDNRIDNLQLLDRKANIGKRGGCKNQYDCINLEKFGSLEALNNYKTELREAKETVEYLRGVFNIRMQNYDYALSQWHLHTGDKWYKENKDKYRELMLTAKDRWHSAVKRYNELRDKTR